ncbi:glycosyltransferase [Escherichia coli]|nr:glycosyltransferase [Escherichia coli]
MMEDTKELITVIMPVYNAEKYIYESIKSILVQSYSNFEFIIINDGSKDSSGKIIENFLDDTRIRYINRENKGLVFTLNEAISLSRGNYIARMDADDISHPLRLEKQLNFLLENPDIAVVGCSSFIIDQNSKVINTRKPPLTPLVNKALLFFGPTLTHPSVMFNKMLLGDQLYYSDKYLHVEDYDLWLRLINQYKIANIKDVLFYYRINESGVSQTNLFEQKINAAKAYSEIKYDGKYKDLLEKLEVIHLRHEMEKSKVFQAVLYILLKYEHDTLLFLK